MNTPLDTIEYLARSAHRVDVLTAIEAAPRTRAEIRELTDASRVTAGRILTDLEQRDWIVRNGQEYETTPDGGFVAREFTRLMDNLATFAELPPVVEWVPAGQPTFDLSRLDDATVTTADEGDLMAPIHRALARIERADDLRVIANSAAREFIEAISDAVDDGQTHTMLLPPEAIAAIRTDKDLRGTMAEILDAPRTSLLRYEGEVELPVVQIAADSVALCSGDHRAMIETDDDTVHEWATAYFESLRADSSPVSVSEFSTDATAAEDGALAE